MISFFKVASWHHNESGFPHLHIEMVHHRKIRLLEGNAKCRYLKKLTCKGASRQVFTVFVLGPEPQTPPPPYILYTCIQYTVLIHTGKGEGGEGRVEPERRLEGRQLTKLGRKYQHDWLYLQPIWETPTARWLFFSGKFFYDILLWCIYMVFN